MKPQRRPTKPRARAPKAPAVITSYAEFWPFYLREHSKRATKTYHAIGTGLGIVSAIAFAYSGKPALIPLSLVFAYGLAWYSHFFIQKNRPATFKYPLWSFISDFRMLYWYFTGKFRK